MWAITQFLLSARWTSVLVTGISITSVNLNFPLLDLKMVLYAVLQGSWNLKEISRPHISSLLEPSSGAAPPVPWAPSGWSKPLEIIPISQSHVQPTGAFWCWALWQGPVQGAGRQGCSGRAGWQSPEAAVNGALCRLGIICPFRAAQPPVS